MVGDMEFADRFASTPDDVMKLNISAIKDVVVNLSWQMVYSKPMRNLRHCGTK